MAAELLRCGAVFVVFVAFAAFAVFVVVPVVPVVPVLPVVRWCGVPGGAGAERSTAKPSHGPGPFLLLVGRR
ncbi:hypothetical protein [Streptomyces narbonensis]|uniref:hypothetical protein n=1 Tax=Streptomyces narbonensis TaxID=67333 RepID=UPI001676BB3C|nr:hypothetical protein [Streptomyces narbonensis]GGV98390.1 hypothetical protein GCM10010230_21820 [Streptomyces narbonensis]